MEPTQVPKINQYKAALVGNQTPNTEHSSRNRDIHILTITLLSLLIRKT